MGSIFRTAFAAALGALILLPLWAANDTVDHLFRGQAQPHATLDLQPPVAGHINGEVLSRLYGVRAEIRSDICRRGSRKYCVLGLCLPLPADCGPERP